eukprot:TRINITY_DN13339_c0_g1_i1.p1 TRINITY_DN13339_c0_g1~~TRINITY_DN13339_c0_g1_i1.p1  ORF type:complete len:314 (-),score=116.60 TRINITY_DN13339_c0_g1_i1:64-1005(-)
MALDKEESFTASSSPITQATDSQSTETIGLRARHLSEKQFETRSTKIVNSINKKVLQASEKGLWRVQVKLPNNLWTSDGENQRRLLKRLKEGDLAAWIKSSSSSVVISVSWSQYDLEHQEQIQEELEVSEKFENEKLIEDKNQESYIRQISERSEPSPFKLLPYTEVDNETTTGREESSDFENESKQKKKENKLKKQVEKEEFRRMKQQNREAKLREREPIKQARKEEKLRMKQIMKEKRKEAKKNHDLQKLKELRQQKKLAKQKRKEEIKKNKGGKKKNQEKKKNESSSSEEERTWSHSDLSSSSDSDTNSD